MNRTPEHAYERRNLSGRVLGYLPARETCRSFIQTDADLNPRHPARAMPPRPTSGRRDRCTQLSRECRASQLSRVI